MADSRILLAALALAATSLAPAVALSGAPRPAAEGLELAAPRTLAPRAAPGLRRAVAGTSLEAMARDYLSRHAENFALAATDDSALGLKAIREGKAVDVVRFRQLSAGITDARGELSDHNERQALIVKAQSCL